MKSRFWIVRCSVEKCWKKCLLRKIRSSYKINYSCDNLSFKEHAVLLTVGIHNGRFLCDQKFKQGRRDGEGYIDQLLIWRLKVWCTNAPLFTGPDWLKIRE